MSEGLYTIGEIADELQEPPARVAYVVSKYRIKPTGRVGIIRQFNPGQVEAIRERLRGIQIRREVVGR